MLVEMSPKKTKRFIIQCMVNAFESTNPSDHQKRLLRWMQDIVVEKDNSLFEEIAGELYEISTFGHNKHYVLSAVRDYFDGVEGIVYPNRGVTALSQLLAFLGSTDRRFFPRESRD